MGDEDDGLLYRCAGSKADRMLFRFGGKAFFAVVGVFIKSALTADSSSKTANNAGAANPNTGATAGVCVAGLALLISGALTVSRKRK